MDSPETIKAITNDLEHGQADSLKQNLHGKFEEERIGTLNQIREQNKQDRAGHADVPELQITTSSSPAANYYSIRLDHGTNSDAFFGGTSIYDARLDLQTLTRSGDDPVPPNRQQIDLEALTVKLEKGNGNGVGQMVSSLQEEERIRVFRDVEKLNQQHLAEHKTTIELYATVSASKSGADTIDIERRLPGNYDAFFGGARIYNEKLDLPTLKRTTTEKDDPRL